MSESHARLGPSNHRWPHCPGSVREEAAYPDISGEAAIDGTGSHLLLELCLKNNVKAEAYDMQVIGANHPDCPNGWLVHQDRIERVQMCLDYISARCHLLRQSHPGCKILVESESTANPGGIFGRDDWWGTCDITITVVNMHNRCVFMEVIDYKDGRGWVDAKMNTQLISYLGGKIRPFLTSGPDQCRPFTPDLIGGDLQMTIVQPKTSPVVRHHIISSAELVEELEKLSNAARATDWPDAKLIPDDKGGKGYCQWCKHKPNCSAHGHRDIEKVMAMTITQDVVATDSGPSLFELANQMLGNIAEVDSMKLSQFADTEAGVMSTYTRVKEEIERRIKAGEAVPGWEMRPGGGRRVWAKSEEEVAKALKGRRLKKEEIYPASLISPAQALKLPSLNDDQKARLEKELIVFKAGEDKLTRVAVERQHTEKDAVALFADVPSFIDPPVESTGAAEPAPELSFL